MYPSQLERYINEYRKKEDGADRAGGREREKERKKTSRRSGSAGGHLRERHGETRLSFTRPVTVEIHPIIPPYPQQNHYNTLHLQQTDK